jgi:ornithine cyclodeaminase
MRIFEEDAIRGAVRRADALEAVERGFAALARGQARLPEPVGLHLPEVEGEVHVKGAHLEGAPIFAFKVASGFYRNPERGLPVGSGLFLVFDARTGAPRALLRDNGWLTELRTGAAGALAARLLTEARPLTVAMVGAGVQARFQIRALAEVREIRELRAWSRRPEGVRAFLDEVGPELGGAGRRAARSAAEAVRGADLVVTVTPAREPVVEDAWVGPGATVVAVGSDGPGKGELAPELVAGADKVVVDRVEQSVRLGELQRPVEAGRMGPEDVHAELGEVVIGRRPGRETPDERIVCDLTGVGVQDVAIAEAAWSRLAGGSGAR